MPHLHQQLNPGGQEPRDRDQSGIAWLWWARNTCGSTDLCAQIPGRGCLLVVRIQVSNCAQLTRLRRGDECYNEPLTLISSTALAVAGEQAGCIRNKWPTQQRVLSTNLMNCSRDQSAHKTNYKHNSAWSLQQSSVGTHKVVRHSFRKCDSCPYVSHRCCCGHWRCQRLLHRQW